MRLPFKPKPWLVLIRLLLQTGEALSVADARIHPEVL
jgi:hypothetical protein